MGRNLDFVCVHFYPKHGEVDKALKALSVYSVGKPVVVEEMFPLSCTLAELDRFIGGSRKMTSGWFGFYWGKTIQTYEQEKGNIADAYSEPVSDLIAGVSFVIGFWSDEGSRCFWPAGCAKPGHREQPLRLE